MSVRVSPSTLYQFDSTDVASARWYASFDAVGNEANGLMQPTSLDAFLDIALTVRVSKAVHKKTPIRLKSILTPSVVSTIATQAATDRGHSLPDNDPIFASLDVLMGWANLGPGRTLVLSRIARGNAIPVIVIFGVSEGDSSTTIFDL